MAYIDISITDTNGNTQTLPGIYKEYVSRISGKYSTACMLNVFGCLINELRKNNVCFETYTFHKSKKWLNVKVMEKSILF